jgi:hypothetical protein
LSSSRAATSGLLTLLGGVLFAAGLTAHAIGRDEAVSVLLVSHPVSRGLGLLAAHEVHPAGYFLALWAWPHTTPLEARLLSWVPAIACIPLVQLAAVRFGLKRPWLAGLAAATSPFLAYYAAEARMYSWLALLGAAALLLLASLPARPGPRWGVGAGLLLAAGLYIHYYALFTALGVLAVLAVRRDFRTALSAGFVAAVAFLPGLVLLAEQLPVFFLYPSVPWQDKLTLTGLYNVSGLLFGGAEYYEPGRKAALLLALPALYGIVRAPTSVKLLLVFGAGLPLLLGVFTSSLSARYLAASVPALLLCLAIAIDSLPARAAIPAGAAAALLGVGLIAYADLRYDNLKPPTPRFLADARANGALLVVNHRHFAPQAAYYSPGGEAFSFPPPKVDHVGIWAVPPGLPYPPAERRPLLFISYCYDQLPLPQGYQVAWAIHYPENDLCESLAKP